MTAALHLLCLLCGCLERTAKRAGRACLRPIQRLREFAWHREGLLRYRARNERPVDFHL